MRGELVTPHGGWSTRNVELQGVNSRLATVVAGGSITIGYDASAAVQCSHGHTCSLQLQVGTNAAKLGCLFAGQAQGDKQNVGLVNVQGKAMTLGTFGTPGVYELVVDPASNQNGCGAAWTNGQPNDANEVIGFVCVTPQ
jgi:hypothetical protein